MHSNFHRSVLFNKHTKGSAACNCTILPFANDRDRQRKYVAASVAVLAEISLRSPRKLFFYYQKIYLSDLSIRKVNWYNFEKNFIGCRMILEFAASAFVDMWSLVLILLAWIWTTPSLVRGNGEFGVGNRLVTSLAQCQFKVRIWRKPHEAWDIMCIHSIARFSTCFFRDSALTSILSIRYSMQDFRSTRACISPLTSPQEH